MPLHSPTLTTEKILLYGQYGAGKTHDIASIILLHISVGSDSKFHIIDTDGQRWKRTIEAYPLLLAAYQMGQILIYEPYTFGEVIEAATQIINSRPRPHDWVIVDRISVCWDRAADWYCETRLKKSLAEVEERYRNDRNNESKGETALLQYYGTGINPMYVHEFEDPLIYRSRCHVIFTANESRVNDPDSRNTKAPKDSQALLTQFAKIGYKPKCKSDTPSKFHTVIYKAQKYKGKWFATTARETGNRGSFDNEEISDFATSYLIQKSGWSTA